MLPKVRGETCDAPEPSGLGDEVRERERQPCNEDIAVRFEEVTLKGEEGSARQLDERRRDTSEVTNEQVVLESDDERVEGGGCTRREGEGGEGGGEGEGVELGVEPLLSVNGVVHGVLVVEVVVEESEV